MQQKPRYLGTSESLRTEVQLLLGFRQLGPGGLGRRLRRFSACNANELASRLATLGCDGYRLGSLDGTGSQRDEKLERADVDIVARGFGVQDRNGNLTEHHREQVNAAIRSIAE
jgi:hypothetical protein